MYVKIIYSEQFWNHGNYYGSFFCYAKAQKGFCCPEVNDRKRGLTWKKFKWEKLQEDIGNKLLLAFLLWLEQS